MICRGSLVEVLFDIQVIGWLMKLGYTKLSTRSLGLRDSPEGACDGLAHRDKRFLW
jgi:hypothetical protein